MVVVPLNLSVKRLTEKSKENYKAFNRLLYSAQFHFQLNANVDFLLTLVSLATRDLHDCAFLFSLYERFLKQNGSFKIIFGTKFPGT